MEQQDELARASFQSCVNVHIAALVRLLNCNVRPGIFFFFLTTTKENHFIGKCLRTKENGRGKLSCIVNRSWWYEFLYILLILLLFFWTCLLEIVTYLCMKFIL